MQRSVNDDKMHPGPTPLCLCGLEAQRGRGVNRGKAGARFRVCMRACACVQASVLTAQS